MPVYDHTVAQWLVMIVLGVTAFLATRNMQAVPRGLQNAWEAIVQLCYDFFGGVLDEHAAKKWTPILATFFLFILTSNYIGLFPGSATIHGFVPPTADWNTNACLALIVFFTVQISGFVAHGSHYLGHFISPHPAFLPLAIIEELVRPLSLTLRLFGNIFGHEMIVSFLVLMAPFLVPMPLVALGVLTGLIQALVFTILATSYVAAATGEGH
ncbi:MAG: F0F1 ATP synthase subunit A [Syntrophomonadaceae bacterium]|nr:F0F1 ATP synthase subunit A [Syntrophomonadaceae bacterium]